ncbi:hypothetical protein BX666DRAFT_61298 [Dichotomocladium elegans]|nr:hypothetical protein BX666DRAFT_61298 [Dichotomocladium elegans]
MAALESDKTDPLYLQLKSGEDEEGWPLLTRKPQKIQLSEKRHHTFAVTVGSGRRLFKNRMTSSLMSSSPSTPRQQIRLVTDDSGKLSVVAVKTPTQERKRAFKKRKGQAAATSGVSVNNRGVTQRQQASTLFCCKPCNKRYKNRSGLTYHLDRCKYQTPPGKENIHCICGNVSQNGQTLVCCQTCQSWLHRSCVGLKDKGDDAKYTCPRCPAAAQTTEQQLQHFPIMDGGADQQQLLWSAAMLEGYNSPWSMPDIPSILFSDPLSMPDEDYGLMTPTSNASLSDTPIPQQDSCWFDFADFDNDFTCD